MSTTQQVVTPAEGAAEIVRRSLKQPTTPQEQIQVQLAWLGVHEGDLVELRTVEPEARAITRSPSKVVELAADLHMVGRFNRAEHITPQGVYLYPNALVPSMAASSDLDVWLAAGSVKISTTKERIAHRRFFYLDFDTEREGGVSVSATSPELSRTIRGALGYLEELAAIVGADPLMFMMSGNGVQEWLRLANIPETPELERLVHRILKYAKAAWSCADYTIDDGVFEANRLAPLAGTVKRKGANYTPADLPKDQHRPHRMVRVVPVGSATPTGPHVRAAHRAGRLLQVEAHRRAGRPGRGRDRQGPQDQGHRRHRQGGQLEHDRRGRAPGAGGGQCPAHARRDACARAGGRRQPGVPEVQGHRGQQRDADGRLQVPPDDPLHGAVHVEHEARGLPGVRRRRPQERRLPQVLHLVARQVPAAPRAPDHHHHDSHERPRHVRGRRRHRHGRTGHSRHHRRQDGYHYSDTGNGQRLVDQFGDVLRYCPEVGMWLAWTGSYWAWDTCSLLVQEKMKLVVAGIHAEAATLDDPDQRKALWGHAMKSESTRSIEAAIKNARSDARVRVGLGDLDRNDDLVNFANGTFDLGSCMLRDHDPRDLLTTLITFDYDADATCPKFLALLERAKPDSEEQAFRIRRLGQYLSGKPDKSFIISWGPKDTAKSTFYQTVATVLGPYAARVPRSVIEKSFHEQHPAQLMTMKGKRLCFGAEIRETIDIDRIKELTGESDIPARGMGENWITIRRTWKLEIYSNDKPRIDFTADDGMATRTIFDPWLVQIPKDEQIPNYHEVLASRGGRGHPGAHGRGLEGLPAHGPRAAEVDPRRDREVPRRAGRASWSGWPTAATRPSPTWRPRPTTCSSPTACWFEKTVGRKLPAKMTKQVFGMRLGKKYPSGQRDNVKVRRGIRVKGRAVPEYDLNSPYIEAPGMVVMDIFYEREIDALMSEGQEAA